MAKAPKKIAPPVDPYAVVLERTERGEPLTQICADKDTPARSSVYEKIAADEDFAGRFHAARARGVHAMADDCLTIADKPAKDAVEVADKRVRIDTRLRLAGKWLPSIYGDKTTTEHTGKVQLVMLPTDDAI